MFTLRNIINLELNPKIPKKIIILEKMPNALHSCFNTVTHDKENINQTN
jgi:hypothetical protein